MAKRHVDRIAEDNRRYEEAALRRGERFRLVSDAGYGSSFVCYPTLAQAQQKLADVERLSSKPIPKDYYLRQASLEKLSLSLEEHDGKNWKMVAGTHRELITGVMYAD